jgi:adenylate cyclase
VSLPLSRLRLCFEGFIPAVIATADTAGVPNVTYLSKVTMVDDDHIALSNQFFSKTSRNLAENPVAELLMIDPTTYDEYRLAITYERTERRGPVFEEMRADVDTIASLQGMTDVFRLRSADVYRVEHVEQVPHAGAAEPRPPVDDQRRLPRRDATLDTRRLAELTARLNRCPDLDTLVATVVRALAEEFGHEHSVMLLLDEEGTGLYTIASHGFDAEGVGSEVVVGEGPIGMAAARCTPIRVGNLQHMGRYSKVVRRSYEEAGDIGPGREIPFPGIDGAQSQLAVPALAMGQLVGVLMVESRGPTAYDESDEAVLTVVAGIVANAAEAERARAASAPAGPPRSSAADRPGPGTADATLVRYFTVDGSTFLDGDYLIKGVAGRILWSLLQSHQASGRTEFTNREVRLDPALELPEFRDNFESRLILLKRRLDERAAPIRIEKTGRGRFRLVVTTALRLDPVD